MNAQLAKLILDLNGNEEKAFHVYNLRKGLTPTGFEYYISYYFEKVLGYKTTIPTNTYSPDGWIDVKWIRMDERWKKEYCIIQCKKHSSRTSGIQDIRAFVGWIYHILSNISNTTAYYISTSCFSNPAKVYAEQQWISLKDFSNIAVFYDKYNLAEFEKDIQQDHPLKYEKIFNKGSITEEVSAQWKLFSSQEDELLKTLKDIRYKIMKKVKVYTSEDITDNSILETLSRKRPQNLEALKSSLYENDFNKDEINKTLQYADEYLKGIKLFI